MSGAAVMSDDGVYRYVLDRDWEPRPRRLCWVMLNPSTADADQDDPTIRRCTSFAKAWGYTGIRVVNLYALRSTDPSALRCHPDPIGPENDEWIKRAVHQSADVICAWGDSGPRDNRGLIVHETIAGLRLPSVLGLTRAGRPKHPLYVRGDTMRVTW